MRRSGFSLLELLIALSLILAMAALTMPVVSRTLAARDFDSTVDRLTHQLRLARAQAQVSGRAVEVICTPDSGRIEARYFDAQQFEADVMSDDFASRESMESNHEGVDSDSTAIPDGWARSIVKGAFKLSTMPPQSDDDSDSPIGIETVRLAIFMPDGSAIMSEPIWLRDADGRSGKLSVSRFTGLPRFERAEDLTSESSSELERASRDDDRDADSRKDSEFRPSDDSYEPEGKDEPNEPDDATQGGADR
ncbi:MAG: prepilin-type N-terminal cleavage/methylation domain-containing protein [Planctomycetota bacterium]|nr:prepilin-type N-terminal cleavage/methylation domain-containing protein [Planctomycetota bacterium]